jgi:hypothetical protein
MFYKLFLDDVRFPKDVTWIDIGLGPFVIVRSYEEFINYITKNGLPNFISFDHDMEENQYRQSMYNPDKHYNNYYTDGTFTKNNGYCCAKWLVQYCIDNKLKLPEYKVHSFNPIGKENIENYLEWVKKQKIV